MLISLYRLLIIRTLFLFLFLNESNSKGVTKENASAIPKVTKSPTLVEKKFKYSNFIREQAENLFFKKKLLEYEKRMDSKRIEYDDNDEVIDPIFQEYKMKIMQEIIRRSSESFNTAQSHLRNNEFSFLETQTKRGIPQPDSPNSFFNEKFERNIEQLPLQGLVKRHPWSGSYWPMRSGMISARYGRNEKNTIGLFNTRNRMMIRQYNWTESVNMYKQPAEHNFQMRRNRTNYERYIFNYYSPSEKYDLLVGDYSFALTNWNKDHGKKWSDQYKGDLPSWFGICHGWAPATYEIRKPIKSINVTAADGITTIRFFPDDIKALASLYWANVHYTTNFVGGICRVQKPKTPISDNSTGLYLETPCHSINPGALVMILGNHVGIKRKNLVLDPLSDPEVWNQPIMSYLFRYYNLITKDFSRSPTRTRIPISVIKNSNNKFLNFLSRQAHKNTVYVTGIYINVTYAYETSPVHSNRPMDDFNKTDEFIAALELDENNNILGGEWKYNVHPNFLWKNDERKPVQGCCDHLVKNFTGKASTTVTKWATEASKKGQVLKPVLDYLIELSSDLHQDEENIIDYRNYLPSASQNQFSLTGSTNTARNQRGRIDSRNSIERIENNQNHGLNNELYDWVFR